jgi:hypothetical protein
MYIMKGIVVYAANKYGSVEFETISDYLPIKEINGKNIPDEYKLSMDLAEQIVLITDTSPYGHVTLSAFPIDTVYPMMLILYGSPNTAAYCKVRNVKFDDKKYNAKEILDRPKSAYMGNYTF